LLDILSTISIFTLKFFSVSDVEQLMKLLCGLVVSNEPVMNIEEEEEGWESDDTESIKYSRIFQNPGQSGLKYC